MKTALMVVVFVCAATLSGAQERLADQLRKGIVQEEARQDLTLAIKTYQAIVAQFDEERRAAASALFRLAECYRKTGKREQAVAAYQRVAREFSDQAELAGPSRQQLASTFGLTEPRKVVEQVRTGSAPRETPRQKMLANQLDMKIAEERMKEQQQKIAGAEHDVLDVEAQLTAFQEKIKAGTAARESTEYLQLQRDLEAAKRNLDAARTAEDRWRDVAPRTSPPRVERPTSGSESPEVTGIAIQAMDAKLAEARKLVETGRLASADYQQLQAEYEMLVQKYRQQMQERKTNEANAAEVQALNRKMIASLEAEIALLTNWIASTEKRIAIGQYSPDNPELLQLRRELLGLQRQREQMKSGVKR